MKHELKPCPFCGGKPTYFEETSTPHYGPIGIYCESCGAAMFHSWCWVGDDETCIGRWNRRNGKGYYEIKTCKGCGKKFGTHNRIKEYCSAKCQKKHNKHKYVNGKRVY